MEFILFKFIGYFIILAISNTIVAATFYKLGKEDAIKESK